MTQNSQTPIPLFSFRISELCQFDYCPKRCKIQCFKQYENLPDKSGGNYMLMGSKMHRRYSIWMNQNNRSFDRELLIKQLNNYLVKDAFQKQMDNILIRGVPDNFRILYNITSKKKVISIVEVKTTNKKFMWKAEIRAAAFQCQLYIWLMKETFAKLGYKLNNIHWVEVYSQKSGALLSRIAIHEDPDIEVKIRYIIATFQGLAPMKTPEKSACKICPSIVKINCPWREGIEHGNM